MVHTAGQIGATRLYPPHEAFDHRMIEVGDGHRLYVEQSGNPSGAPVVVLHGGPGGGCSPYMRRFFDPAYYRIILFDQRGCGRSTPRASVAANTTWHLVADIELIRRTLGIESWAVFGGSWGATLALAYAQAHPEAVRALILRGVFLGRQAELDWFFRGGAALFWPERWQAFCAPILEAERDDIIAAYHRRLFSGDPATEQRFARSWVAWESGTASMDAASGGCGGGSDEYFHTFARLECHYFHNRCFLEEGQLLRDRAVIAHIPCHIVQGRYDMVCPPASAFELAQGWAKCQLQLIASSGHALNEPRIAAALVAVMNKLREQQ